MSACARARRGLGYTTDSDVTVAAFALSGGLFVADLVGADAVRALDDRAR